MKNKIIFSLLLSAGILASCSGDHASKPGVDSAGNNIATNPYRDTFATTSSYGDATTTDNTGSGGAKVVKPHAGAPEKMDTVKVDTTKKM